MRRPDTSGEALPSPGRKTETTTASRISKTTALMALALLAQCGHDAKHGRETDQSGVVSASVYTTVPAEVLEEKRHELAARIRVCAGRCTASEAVALATVCGDKPLTPEKLSEAASKLTPELRSSVHAIAEILRDYPELAPDVLTCLHQFLSDLPMTDARKLAGMIIPCRDDSLEDSWNIQTTSREFLRLETQAGAYRETNPETLTADTNVRSILTKISNSVESTR